MSDVLYRIHAALDRIESSLQRSAPATGDGQADLVALARRHALLRDAVNDAVASLDGLLPVTKEP